MQDQEEKDEAVTSTAGEPQTAAAEGSAATTEAPRNPNMKWYIIHSYSGFERKVKESLESRVTAFGLQDKIGKVLIPTESVTEVRSEHEVVHHPLVFRIRAQGEGVAGVARYGFWSSRQDRQGADPDRVGHRSQI